ncbi:MAG: FecR domain-containing protein [Bauldia sp.]|nr:FecR domain-containing protein [Bauldia sp.]
MGTAIEVRPAAVAIVGESEVAVVSGSQLFEGQRLQTGASGEIQIVFTDGTRMVIGPQSTLVIERYLLQNTGTVEAFAVNALSGSFRFITGNGPSSAYSISTPAGTIGIRGTEFDFSYNPRNGRMSALLYSGAITLCARNTACVVLDEACEVGTSDRGGGAGLANTEADRLHAALSVFPYASNQEGLQPTFRVDDPGFCLVDRTVPPAPTVRPGPPPPPGPPPEPLPPPPDPPPPPPPDPPPPPPPLTEPTRNNNGIGNGGEGDEGPTETGNPGQGATGGNGPGGGNGPPSGRGPGNGNGAAAGNPTPGENP